MKSDNIAILNETLRACGLGSYDAGGKRVKLKLTPDEMRAARVFMPDEIHALADCKSAERADNTGRCSYICENIDSYSLARKFANEYGYVSAPDGRRGVLVLNLANSVHPGGGARHGANAQEESLCRCSSLLLSLESADAAKYYDYNRSLGTRMGSDAMIFSPNVEVVRDRDGGMLGETTVVSVLTCAAPSLSHGFEGLTDAEYRELMFRRITGIFYAAAYLGYGTLVLGAFGCGAFGNDAKVVSDIFYKALKEFRFGGLRERDVFRRIGFAVLCRDSESYNFDEFYRNFGGGSFYRDEDAAGKRAVKAEVSERD